ncbi:MAG: TlpA disulfide reductase family protein [Arachidicoccus sp.]|nr:TlpA disulfide reductase family protein [Arachidicoccus sp.]
MKTKNVILILLLIPFSGFTQNGYIIQGKIPYVLKQPTKIFLNYIDDTTNVLDSTVLDKGNFIFKGHLSSPAGVTLTVQNNPNEPLYKQKDRLYFYLENSDINIVFPDSLKNAIVKGSRTNDDDIALHKIQMPYSRSADSLTKVYYSLTPEQRIDSSFLIPARKIMTSTQHDYDSVTKSFIYTHLNSYVSLEAFKEVELAYNFNPDTAQPKFDKFSTTLKESSLGKEIQTFINKNKATMMGRIAPDFAEKDTLGNLVKLSDFRGHYVLLDFWASWCHPCRAENPNLVAAFKKYKGNNFTILSVSLDEAKIRSAWVNAVRYDGLPWIQISELKGFKSSAAQLYGIEAIPSNFLIDPNGKIIARNLRGNELDEKLETLFGKK